MQVHFHLAGCVHEEGRGSRERGCMPADSLASVGWCHFPPPLMFDITTEEDGSHEDGDHGIGAHSVSRGHAGEAIQ
jgi:hypothetical protein